MNKLWQRITYCRHCSELWALGLAKRAPSLAIFPIAIVLLFWWGVAGLTVLLPTLLLQNLGALGDIVLAALGISVVPMGLLLAAPWFFGWYGIAVSLMFGRFTSASAKEKALMESIRAYRANAV
ncbi:hypothetical protein [Rhizobium leguminosarum]|uniref:hypothetical protein n=1 Tax=Rhizobium leguminosarum TaxID=384 RepID=UPI001AE95AEE|nr:hypothetical protein [Rhizobium leguminosarum]MBP2446930.1 hypothetical protein [Rhizobium leguminosarum]